MKTPVFARVGCRFMAWSVALWLGLPAWGQPMPAPLASRQERTPVDSGFVENLGGGPGRVFETKIEVPGALWLRLTFEEVVLAGDESEGTGSYLVITSVLDGAVQTMHATHLGQWRNTSAYFNGDVVRIELVAHPQTGPNRLVIVETSAGIASGNATRSICGPTDDRELSDDPRAGRLMPIGCTAWMINDANHCFLTAGHCISNGTSNAVMEFNVPLSNPNGTVNHPPPEDQYSVDVVSINSNGGAGVGNDWAYFGCFANSSTGLTPYQAQGDFYFLVTPPPVSGQAIRITGYGTTSPPVSPTWNQAQKTHTGPYTSFSGTTVRYATDTTGGNSGSPVINDDTGEAIGIHTHGGCSSGGGANNGTGSNHAALQNALANPQGICVALPVFVYPDGMPEIIDPAGGTTLRVEVVDQGGQPPQPGVAQLHYDAGEGFNVAAMQEVSPNVYDAVFPAIPCGTIVDYYFNTWTVSGFRLLDPVDAPATVYSVTSALSTETVAAFDFEEAPGWTVENVDITDGAWERGVPVGDGDQGDPTTDFDGSGQCFLTDNAEGNSDVDGGPTRLISPSFDLSGTTYPMLSYARWFSNSNQDQDRLDVELSDDDGGTWALVESVPDTEGWVLVTVPIAEFVGLTSQVKVRFSATDNPSNSITEAAVDTVIIRDCDVPILCTKGDTNQDDVIDGRDIDDFTSHMIDGVEPGTVAFCTVDMDGDGVLELDDDVSLFVGCLVGGPCE